MSKASNTDHPIYKERGKLNRQIGLLLLAFVILVMIATIAKLSTGRDELANAPLATSEVTE